VTAPTIRFQVRFRGRDSALVAPRVRKGSQAAQASSDAPAAPTALTAARGAPTPAARVLALAYSVERQVRTGAIRNYREAARRLGISHARMSQVMALLWLAPRIQAEVLIGRAPWSEVRLRAATRHACWQVQREATRV